MKQFLSFIFLLVMLNSSQAQNSCGLIENSTLEGGLAPGWSGDNFVTVVDTTSHQGSHSLAFLPDPANPNLTSVANSSQTTIPSGTSYVRVSFWVHVKESYVNFDGGYYSIPWGGCHVGAAFLSNDGTWLGSEVISEIQNTVGAQQGFVIIEQTIPVVAGAEKLQLFVTKRGPGYMFLDDICATPTSSVPVSMGAVNAFVKGKQIEVNWSTFTENNNDYFEVLVSSDGKNFTALGTVNSKAIDGNSTTTIDYSLTKTLPASMSLLAIPALLGFFAFRYDKKRIWYLVLMSMFALAVFFSCNKSTLINENVSAGKVFVQIKKVDKDGQFKLSAITEAVMK